MSEQTAETTTEIETPKATPAMQKAFEALGKAEVTVAIAFDKLRIVSKTSAASEKWSKKQLNSALLGMGLDKSRSSEIAGWVFPTNIANRAILDDVAAYNAKQTDAKKRIGKQQVLDIQRSEIPLTEKTAEELLASLAAAKATAEKAAQTSGTTTDGATGTADGQTREARPPGSEVAPHGSGIASGAAAAQNAQNGPKIDVGEQIQNAFCAALNLAKANGYDLADCHAELDIAAVTVKIDGFQDIAGADEEKAES